MNFRNARLLRSTFSPLRKSTAEYSRKNNPNHEKYYKIVVKVDNSAQSEYFQQNHEVDSFYFEFFEFLIDDDSRVFASSVLRLQFGWTLLVRIVY